MSNPSEIQAAARGPVVLFERAEARAACSRHRALLRVFLTKAMTRSIMLQLPAFAQPGVRVASVSQPRGFPIVETAPWYHAVPSAVLHDQVQYMRTGALPLKSACYLAQMVQSC